MWIIVAVTMSFSGAPKLAVLPGAEFPTEEACVKATHVKGNFDSEHADQGKLAFSFCVPKDSVQIGARAQAGAPNDSEAPDTHSEAPDSH